MQGSAIHAGAGVDPLNERARVPVGQPARGLDRAQRRGERSQHARGGGGELVADHLTRRPQVDAAGAAGAAVPPMLRILPASFNQASEALKVGMNIQVGAGVVCSLARRGSRHDATRAQLPAGSAVGVLGCSLNCICMRLASIHSFRPPDSCCLSHCRHRLCSPCRS